ncbi:hypothetical protein GCM10012284_23700 [Mangrovihabitans endophyticus]|uniref:Uncharacterized protein n=1 Tax=Mangrovihabitans endophyticus TaxID=1751298 RepID=A0A8J3C056_9ACTN|nr:hypothetical protein GCM10012284_23700 [Mangrovihabitans endophyticus]
MVLGQPRAQPVGVGNDKLVQLRFPHDDTLAGSRPCREAGECVFELIAAGLRRVVSVGRRTGASFVA